MITRPTTLTVCSIFVVAVFCGCLDSAPAIQGDQKDFNPAVLAEDSLMRRFSTEHPGLAVIKYARADLDSDGREDVIVIYRVAADKNMMCVLCQQGEAVIETNSVPAPMADQTIQFRNIDEKPPLEFIVQGRKGAKVGYAIYRVEQGILTDLFGQGMQDCC